MYNLSSAVLKLSASLQVWWVLLVDLIRWQLNYITESFAAIWKEKYKHRSASNSGGVNKAERSESPDRKNYNCDTRRTDGRGENEQIIQERVNHISAGPPYHPSSLNQCFASSMRRTRAKVMRKLSKVLIFFC